MINDYLDRLKEIILYDDPKAISDVKIVYTPLHGTGGAVVPKALEKYGFKNIHFVEEQMKPDGNFPTVRKPNPEEPDALDMAISLAKKIDADGVIANDPDSDRLGTVVKHNGSYVILTGNQLGNIFVHFILSQLKQQNKLPENGFIVETIVSTRLAKKIAEGFGVKTLETLTGFKWICNKALEYSKTGASYIFGFEESFGYHMADFVRDKDGIIASLLFAQVLAYAKANNMSLVDYLEEIQKQFGYSFEINKSIEMPGKEGQEKINAIMQKLRSNPPKELKSAGNLILIEDILESKGKDLVSGKEYDIDLPKSNVLTFEYSDGIRINARPSGTEPKIKFYFHAYSKEKQDLKAKLENVMQEFLGLLQ